jgi:hypothetical protein
MRTELWADRGKPAAMEQAVQSLAQAQLLGSGQASLADVLAILAFSQPILPSPLARVAGL